MVFDLNDPYNPKAISEFMLPGQDDPNDRRVFGTIRTATRRTTGCTEPTSKEAMWSSWT